MRSGSGPTVAKELASVKRSGILKGEAWIGKKRKDVSFEKASELFLQWATTNTRPTTVRVYRQHMQQLSGTFANKSLSHISSFDVKRHKRQRAEAALVCANRELATLKSLFNRAKAWGL